MTHTVVGLFDSKEEARDAMQELVKAGFIKEDVDLSNRRVADAAVPSTTTESGDLTDSVSNFFSSLFGDDERQLTNYTNVAREADAILTVQTDSRERAEEAADILDNHNAINVNERSAQYQQRNMQSSGTAQRTGNFEGETTIPVVEENLEVGKRTVETGGVRVRSRVIEKPVEETVRLREEHVVIDRRPVNREVTQADMNNLQEGTFEITEHAEKAVVSKQARVVEEIAVGKTVEEHQETVSDTVRRTDVDVEEIEGDDTVRRAANR